MKHTHASKQFYLFFDSDYLSYPVSHQSQDGKFQFIRPCTLGGWRLVSRRPRTQERKVGWYKQEFVYVGNSNPDGSLLLIIYNALNMWNTYGKPISLSPSIPFPNMQQIQILIFFKWSWRVRGNTSSHSHLMVWKKKRCWYHSLTG